MAVHVTSGNNCPLTKCRMFCSGGFEVNDKGCQICKCKQPRSIDEHADEFLHENMVVEQRQGKKFLTRMGRSTTTDEYLPENMIVEQRQQRKGGGAWTRLGRSAISDENLRDNMTVEQRQQRKGGGAWTRLGRSATSDEYLRENKIVEQRQQRRGGFYTTRFGRSATSDEYLRENMIVEQRQGKGYITRMGGRATCDRFVRCRMSCHRRGGFKVTAKGCVLCACNGKTPRSIDEHAQEDLRGNEESNLEKRQSFLRFGRGGKTETAFKNIFKLARIPTQL